MNYDDEDYSPYGGGFGSGCDVHGEDYLRECTMCGTEFCSVCFPNSSLCSDCSAQAEFEEEDDENADDEVKDLHILDEFNDDEPELGDEDAPFPPRVPIAKPVEKASPVPPPPKSAKPAPRAKAAPKQQSSAKAKAQPKTKAAPKAKAKPAPKSKRKG